MSNSEQSAGSIEVCALYKFVSLNDYEELRESILEDCLELGVKGTLLLAEEGINGTIAASPEAMQEALKRLKQEPRLSDLEHKSSFTDENPFYRMKVKLKKEIVTLGVPGIDPNAEVGAYVEPQDWNALISDPEVVLVDTRNTYETDIGTFKGAELPETTNFREFPEYVAENLDPKQNKKVAMFCTGGIRCEKATAYMLKQGFEEVYHLKGGILKYLEEVPEDKSLWEGECFVFDNRVAVDHALEPGSYDMCHACRHPISAEDKESKYFIPGVSCPHCWSDKTEEDRERFSQRQQQIQLAKQRNLHHIGMTQAEIEAARKAKKIQRAQQVERSMAGQKPINT